MEENKNINISSIIGYEDNVPVTWLSCKWHHCYFKVVVI